MFVGEAPGQDEDREGEPFVGAAGQLLTKIIEATGLDRNKVYIANILKCRPDTPGKAFGNRKPRPDEMETCFPWVRRQIEIIQPRVMVALGGTARHLALVVRSRGWGPLETAEREPLKRSLFLAPSALAGVLMTLTGAAESLREYI